MKYKVECFVSKMYVKAEAALLKMCQRYPLKLDFLKALDLSSMLMLFKFMGTGPGQQ